MTDVTPTITPMKSRSGLDGYLVVWEGITYNASNISGVAYSNVAYSDRSVQVLGTFGSGGHVKLMGSNDGTTWVNLTDPQGNALDFTAAGLETVMELTRYFRPTCTAGDGTTDLDVYLLLGGGKK